MCCFKERYRIVPITSPEICHYKSYKIRGGIIMKNKKAGQKPATKPAGTEDKKSK